MHRISTLQVLVLPHGHHYSITPPKVRQALAEDVFSKSATLRAIYLELEGFSARSGDYELWSRCSPAPRVVRRSEVHRRYGWRE